jgi:rod shape-determining protein MreC
VVTPRRPARPGYILAVLVLAAATLITVDARGGSSSVLQHIRDRAHAALSSVQAGIHDGLRPVGDFLTGAVNYGSLEADNSRLRAQLAAARAAQYQAAYDQQQADQVLRLSHIPFASDYRTVVAEVTDGASSNFEQTVTIGKGTSSGVSVGEPVVTAAGLAGQVSAATAGSATVTLITDPQLVVGVGLPGGNIGSAQGLGPNRGLDVNVIATSAAPPALRPGAVVYTSAAGHAFPQGIPVGTVSSVHRPVGDSEPSIAVRPLADTADMDVVTVLLWLPQ